MRTVELGNTGIQVPNVILGMMRIGEKTGEEIRELYQTAREVGINYFDHADVYWEYYHECEERFANALALTPSERDQIILQSKAGIIKGTNDNGGQHFDYSYEHLIKAAEESLVALKTDRLDVLLLHRPDTLVEPEEVARAFDELHDSGKVLHFGVSNQTPGFIELLKTAVKQPLVANQLQLSVTHASLVGQEIAANMVAEEQSIMRDGEILNYSRINKMTIQAWSPFQAGFFTGTFIGNPEYRELNAVLDRIASKYQVTTAAIATAWITSHPANMQVVLGTTTPSRVIEAAAGSSIQLTRPEWYELFRAAGHIVP